MQFSEIFPNSYQDPSNKGNMAVNNNNVNLDEFRKGREEGEVIIIVLPVS